MAMPSAGPRTFTAYVEWDPETHLYVGIVPGIPGAHTQASTLDERRENLKEVLALCLEDDNFEHAPRFVGIQQGETFAPFVRFTVQATETDDQTGAPLGVEPAV